MGRLVSGNKTEVKKCRKCRRIVKNGSTTLHASDSIKKRENRENVRFSFFDVPKTQEKRGKREKVCIVNLVQKEKMKISTIDESEKNGEKSLH